MVTARQRWRPTLTLKELSALNAEVDEAIVLGWLGAYLMVHLVWWSQAYELNWTAEDIAHQLSSQDLAGRDWRGIVAGAADPEQFVAVARDADGTVRGIVWASKGPERFVSLPVGSLDWVYVDPDYRSHGLGGRLLEAAKTWMAEQGCVGAQVFVTGINTSAVSLYEGQGFNVVDHRMLAPITS